LALIASSVVAAKYYAGELDKIKLSDGKTALLLAYCLIEYVNACNVAFECSEGGYRRYFGAYLILRKSLQQFGVLGPWEKFIEQFKVESNGESPSPLAEPFSDKQTSLLLTIAPRSERPVIEQVLQNLSDRNKELSFGLDLVNMIPGVGQLSAFATSYSLQIAFNVPQLLMAGQWSGSVFEISTNGSCSFCGGPAPCERCISQLIWLAQHPVPGRPGS